MSADPLARIDVALLDAGFLEKLYGLLGAAKAHGLVLVGTEGYRSPERSDELYAAYLKGGPRAAPAGKSAHNYGKAADFLAMRAGVPVASSDAPEYLLLEELAPRYALKTLRALQDGGHVELDGWEFHDVIAGSSTTPL